MCFSPIFLIAAEIKPPNITFSPLKLSGPSGRIPPIIRQGPANQTLSRGATALLHCRLVGGVSVKILWEKDGERLQGNIPRLTLMENGTLQITDLKVCARVSVCVWSVYWRGLEKDELWKSAVLRRKKKMIETRKTVENNRISDLSSPSPQPSEWQNFISFPSEIPFSLVELQRVPKIGLSKAVHYLRSTIMCSCGV